MFVFTESSGSDDLFVYKNSFKLLLNIRLVCLEICKMTAEQRINAKFSVKLGKTAMETLKMLHEVYRNSCMSRARVFECIQAICGGQGRCGG